MAAIGVIEAVLGHIGKRILNGCAQRALVVLDCLLAEHDADIRSKRAHHAQR